MTKYTAVLRTVLLSSVLSLSVFPAVAKLSLVTVVDVKNPQDAFQYLPKDQHKSLISPARQQQLTHQFLKNYFMPWHNKAKKIDRPGKVTVDKTDVDFYMKPAVYGYNFRPYSHQYVSNLIFKARRMRVDFYPAIVTASNNLRSLPTDLPFYHSSSIAGQGYPFDTLQISTLWVATPVWVTGLTQDGQWAHVKTLSQSGWIDSRFIAKVSPKFIKQFESATLQAVVKDDVPIHSETGHFLYDSKIGMLLPSVKHQLYVPYLDIKTNHVMLLPVKFNKSAYVRFPWTLTPEHMALLMNQMLGEPYSWGGYMQYRDCSLTIKSLFTGFGVWLPRSSTQQAQMGPYIPISGLSVKRKQELLKTKAQPLLSLITFPGHVALYLGEYDGKFYVFQDKWGMHTHDEAGNDGRAVIGKTVITPLSIGRDMRYVGQEQLVRANKIINLGFEN